MRHPKDYQQLPNLLSEKSQLEKILKNFKIAVFIDYDGTLTPIAHRPEQAILDDDMRQILNKLSKIATVTIITGRDIENVKHFVQLPTLIYAGNHGFDIEGPGDIQFQQLQDPNYFSILRQVAEQCQLELNMPGIQIELKKFTIAVHYRHLEAENINHFKQKIQEIVKKYPALKLGLGKKVLEFRPNINWDKGKAMRWVAKKLNLNQSDFFHFYIGDDMTDEDAFRDLPENGMGILVANHEQKTYADFVLNDTLQVKIFLEILLKGKIDSGHTHK